MRGKQTEGGEVKSEEETVLNGKGRRKKRRWKRKKIGGKENREHWR